MTIQQVIDAIDSRKANLYPIEQKIAWLNDLDGLVWREVMLTHEGIADGKSFNGYNQETPPDTELLVQAPYADIYRYYIAVQIDDSNRDTNEYAKSKILFNSAWQTLCDYVNRNYPPVRKVTQLRF